ncbi:PREDICTED: probable pectinesterase/pectinesterase inhibitor 17 [Nelumbo nucifera]|uniref:Probable pectinesterase/pectinesterase inhibitor 17 n=1 Tax=Nelumbo nucifera TaxID=4432 RepID=A0A1U8BAF0_NELNU|nr:PREDICTED: probable pectinesterase/pectinesterase inhibitor 17 [Nelumbo nucifera]
MATPDLVSSNGTTSSYLGRPWKKYSRTVYLQSSIDSFIDPAGWIAWSGDFALSTLYYVEYNNTGAGSGDDWLPAKFVAILQEFSKLFGAFNLGDFIYWLGGALDDLGSVEYEKMQNLGRLQATAEQD